MEPGVKDYFRVIVKRWWLILLAAGIFGGAAGVYHEAYSVPEYEASTKLVLNNVQRAGGTVSPDYNEINSNLMLIETYAEIIQSPAIMNKVAEAHGEWGKSPKDLMNQTKIQTNPKSQVMGITVRDLSPEQAVAIVNAIAQTFKQEIPQIMSVDNVAIFSEASLQDSLNPVTHSLMYMITIAVILSVLVSIAFIFLMEYMDDSIDSESDIQRYLNQPTLTVVLQMRKGQIRKGLKNSRKNIIVEPVKLSRQHKA
ncbi:hypothetical protein PghCCS26_38220 [Paenibacillus glycanilyticus]|uniref:Polysaccharide chain length determinant N-terminal domain-containing protein n=1 Tax=Paenibacillus glycanilyticus TaxID=126569 RepID=A0ABQ6NNM6_9BACL|nr:Wzz/FepE/Etk N-terminal domain-containing protein [Paenibacillus glycanilyticus]GMK46693.1 hypothetical protein PghCCS26_38220 [Paenibacillus glycanilyticus]